MSGSSFISVFFFGSVSKIFNVHKIWQCSKTFLNFSANLCNEIKNESVLHKNSDFLFIKPIQLDPIPKLFKSDYLLDFSTLCLQMLFSIVFISCTRVFFIGDPKSVSLWSCIISQAFIGFLC